jgi:hypothetical protein
MLAGSNIFMNLAWYGHLKEPNKVLWVAVLGSWALAFCEYCLAVPANRIGSKAYSLAQLKTMQEVFSRWLRAGGMGAVRAEAGVGAARWFRADRRGCGADFQRELN